MTTPLLQVEIIQKKIGRQTILEDVSFTLNSGESLLIQGKSGCGKTTLLRCIALLEEIDRGQIIFDGKVVSTSKKIDPSFDRSSIGMVFQQLYLWPHLTVLENVALPLWLRNQGNRKVANKLAIEKLAQLGIDDKIDRYPQQLSGGQKQRVALARALVHSPKLLLLDEITANLDPETAQTVLNLVEEIIITGTSVILISHSSIESPVWSYKLDFNSKTLIAQSNDR
jgi:polar amino acid transport system ATP-binding protein